MAVVVQTMVRCEVAGVGFTINPVSGSLKEMVVNANFGLGESVVSGDGEPAEADRRAGEAAGFGVHARERPAAAPGDRDPAAAGPEVDRARANFELAHRLPRLDRP